MEDRHSIVDRIDFVLKEKKLKREALADSCGISKNNFSNWSIRGTIPPADTIFKIAEYLEVSAQYLVTGETESGLPQDVLDIATDINKLGTLDGRISPRTFLYY